MPSHYQGTSEEIQALTTLIKLNRASNSVNARLFQRDLLGDLTPRQFGVLETLYHLGPLTPGMLSEKLLKSGGNMTFIVNNLVKNGLVSRERDTEDRRVVIVSLTETGKERIRKLLPQLAADVVREMGVLTVEEQETFGRLCRKLGQQERA